MAFVLPCDVRDNWAAQLEVALDAFLGKTPKDATWARSIESLAEALDIVLRTECKPMAGTTFGQPLNRLIAARELAEKILKVEESLEALKKITRAPEELPAPPLEFSQVTPNVPQKEISPRVLDLLTGEFTLMVDELRAIRRDIDAQEGALRRIRESLRSLEADMNRASGLLGVPPGGVRTGATSFSQPVVETPIGVDIPAEFVPPARTGFQQYGALAEFSAVFRERDSATNLARTYQANGIPSFVFFDPTAFTPSPILEAAPVVIRNPVTGELEERTVRQVPVPEIDPKTGRPKQGVWRVEIGIPTEAERELVRVGRIVTIPPSPPGVPPEKVPPDPKKQLLLIFPPRPEITMGAIVEGPTILDALVDSEFGGIVRPGAEPLAPCDCVPLPEDKQLCTRKGVIGFLSQAQVRTLCSEIRPVTDGRARRSQILREGQAICGALVEGIPDVGERFAARFTCLSDFLTGRGISA